MRSSAKKRIALSSGRLCVGIGKTLAADNFRSEGNTRLYTQEDVERLEVILKLTRELGVNLAGVEIILNMRDRMSAMEKEVQAFMEFVRGQVVTYEADASRGQNAMVRVVPPRLIRSLSRQGEHHPAAESNQSHSSQLSAATRKP